ncbi:hypothetical protein AB0I89_23430 [Micromonospora sp. NPDC049801]|uniref:hypothetical protein n=1 Tax=unclassified Micromonospora TaxID=2617518 RepID=UPI0033D5054A
MNGWELAGYTAGFAALLTLGALIVREFVLDEREHRAANERIGTEHQPVLAPAQAWQESCGAGSTVFPVSRPRRPSWLSVWWRRVAWAGRVAADRLMVRVGRGGRVAEPGGKRAPTVGWSPREVARHLAARDHLSQDKVDRIVVDVADRVVRDRFEAAWSAAATDAGQMPERLPWDVVDRAKGSAAVPLPFDEQIRAQNDVLHWLVRPDVPGDQTQVLPTVTPGGAR